MNLVCIVIKRILENEKRVLLILLALSTMRLQGMDVAVVRPEDEKSQEAYSKSLLELAKLYMKGIDGGKPDYESAKKWLEKAAVQEDEEVSAWVNLLLAELYYFGHGVEQNIAEAKKYANAAAKRLKYVGVLMTLADSRFKIICELVSMMVNELPLHYAVRRGNKELVEVLLAKGANIGAVDRLKRNPLHLAAWHGDCKEVVEVLLTKGADKEAVDNFCRTPLHYAAMSGKKAVVESLLASGVNRGVVDNNGKRAVDYAKSKKLKVMLK